MFTSAFSNKLHLEARRRGRVEVILHEHISHAKSWIISNVERGRSLSLLPFTWRPQKLVRICLRRRFTLMWRPRAPPSHEVDRTRRKALTQGVGSKLEAFVMEDGMLTSPVSPNLHSS